MEQLALRWQLRTVSPSRGFLADEGRRIACIDYGSFRSTKGRQRGIREFEVSLSDQLLMPNIEASNGNADCRDREKND
jgi:hypothetical protein